LGFNNYCCSTLQVYSKVSGDQPPETTTIDVSSKEFYGEGYDDSDKRIPDMTIINKQLGKSRFSHSLILFDHQDYELTYL
jgi:UDP-apiose/xylose synthase